MKDKFENKIFMNEEQEDWARLSPQQRYLESCKLWSTYRTLGGCLDPEPDSQSPFDFPELQRAAAPILRIYENGERL